MTTPFSAPEPAIVDPHPEFQFLIYNVSKPANVGNMLRSAVAFGGKTVIVVGQRKIGTFGAHNTEKYLKFNHFEFLHQAVDSLHERGFEIVGVEIGNGATSLLSKDTPAFTKPTCFIFGEEGHGMSATARKACDRFVYIPQYGAGTASLNVSNAAAIMFQHFAMFANYKEAPVEGEKFVVDDTQNYLKPQRDENGNVVLRDHQLKVREERMLKKQKREQEEANNKSTTDANGDEVKANQNVSLTDSNMQVDTDVTEDQTNATTSTTTTTSIDASEQH